MDTVLLSLLSVAATTAAGRMLGEVMAKLEDEISETFASQLGARRQLVRSELTTGADIVLETADRNDVAVEVKVLRYSTSMAKTLRNRMQELLASAVTIRRALHGDGVVVAVVGILNPPYPSWRAIFESSTGDPLQTLAKTAETQLLRGSDGAGFDWVILGLAREDGEWLVLDSQGEPSTYSTFAEAVASIDHYTPFTPAERAEVGPQPGHDRPPRLFFVADEWNSSRGGISTINRELAIALAARGADVTVVVPNANPNDRDAAASVDVNLVSPAEIPGLSEREMLCTRPITLESDYYPDVVVGHGRILGPYAMAIHAQFYPESKRVHVVHTDAEQLEAAKEVPGGPSRMSLSDERRALETKLAISADVVVGVGPLLTETIAHAMRGQGRAVPPRTVELTPGLRDWGGVVDADDPPQINQVLVLARAEDSVSKGLDIAAQAVVHASIGIGATPGNRPTLVVRGVPAGSQADSVKAYLDSVAKPAISIILRPFSEDESSIRSDLWQSRAVLMPSRHEGFGLAALEAIAAGVPVLISAESGLARLLERALGEASPQEVLPTQGAPDDIDRQWGESLAKILKDPSTAFARAASIRRRLSQVISWDDAAAAFLEAISPDGRSDKT